MLGPEEIKKIMKEYDKQRRADDANKPWDTQIIGGYPSIPPIYREATNEAIRRAMR